MRSALRARVRKPVSKRRNRYLLIAAVLFMLTAVSVYAYFSPGFKLASWGEGTLLVVGNSKRRLLRAGRRAEIYIAVEPLRDH